jgi:dienelactone hydrolase
MLHKIRRHANRPLFLTVLAIVLALLALGLFLLWPRRADAQDLAARRAYLVLRGEDTVVFQRLERVGAQLRAEIVAPGQPRVTLVHSLDGDRITRTEFAVYAPNAVSGDPVQSGAVELRGDSAIMEITAGGRTQRLAAATPAGTLPIVNNDFVAGEIAVARARRLGVRSLPLSLYALSAARVIDGRVDLVGTDSATFTLLTNVTTLSLDANGRITGGAIPQAGLRIVVLEGADAARLRATAPDYSAPADAPYTAEEVQVRTPAGHTLAGTLTMPKQRAARVPAVVTITGSGHQDRDEFVAIASGYRLFREVADTLSRRGIAVLRLDDRGIGGSGGDVAGTTADFADDIRAAVAYLRSRDDIDPARIALVGHSEGGTIAPMVASTDSQLAGVVLLAGTGYTGRRIIDYQIENGVRGSSLPEAQHDSLIAVQKAEFESSMGRNRWMQYFLTYDPVPTARRVTQPALILNGATDQQVRPEEARLLEAAMKAGGNTRVTVRIMPDLNHFFIHDPSGHPEGYATLRNAKVDRETLGLVADWLVTTLGVR